MSPEPTPESEAAIEPSRRNEPEHPLYKLVIVSSAAFLITVLSMVAVMMGSGESPLAKFINRNGLRMIGVEVVLIIVCGILAMAADRRRTMLLQRQAEAVRSDSEEDTSSEPRIDSSGHGTA